MDIAAVQDWAYIPDLPDEVLPIRNLLHDYSGIPLDEVDKHILRVRQDAWNASRFPCFGRWKFLNLINPEDPRFRQVLFRLRVPKSRDALLDLGCCVGQVLRQFRNSGVDGARLYGVDLEPRFIDIGYSLFRDRRKLGSTFVVGDVLDPDDCRIRPLNGKVTMIHASSFFHLFNWIQQLYLAKRLVDFLKPGTRNGLVFGRQVGTSKAGKVATSGASVYLHDQDSFQRLWDEVGTLTKTKWKVAIEVSGEPMSPLPGHTENAFPVDFTVYQLS